MTTTPPLPPELPALTEEQFILRAALDPTLQLIQLLGANGYAGAEPFRWAKEIQAALEKLAGGG